MVRVSPHLQRAEHFRTYAEKIETAIGGGHRLVFAAPPQHGKAVATSTPMLTRRGWVKAGDVRLGDELVGSDGRWTRVLGVFPQGTKALNRVAFKDGATLDVCDEHLWSVRQRYGYAPSIKTTEELRGDLHEPEVAQARRRASRSGARLKWRVPVVEPLECLSATELPIDPYLLGLWLGDGNSANAAVTTADSEVVAAFEAAGYDVRLRSSTSSGRASSYGIRGMQSQLRELGLLGNKHVPERYLLAGREQRLALLQGLCDTDGTVAANGSQQSFCTTSPRLAEAFRFLVCSLGGTWSEYAKRCKTTRVENSTAWVISFRLPQGVSGFRLARKASLLNAYSGRQKPRRLIKSIERIGAGEAVCFTVDAPDHLFCAGRDLVVTHNTELTLHGLAWLILNFPGRRHAYITYSLWRARSVARKVKRILQSAGIVVGGTLSQFELPGGGQCIFTSIDGGITGEPVDGIAVIDDPVKNRREADSAVRRETIEEAYRTGIETRVHEGASVLLLATRWHPQDLSGVLVAEGWEYINLPAIAENDSDPNGRANGEPLFPAMWSLEALLKKKGRVLAFTWEALYQGRPRPKGGKVFHEPTFYGELPTEGYRGAFGVDLAATAKTSADWSICVELLRFDRFDRNGKLLDPLYYVREVNREQVEAPDFALVLHAQHVKRPHWPLLWRASGMEKGAAQFIQRKEIPLRVQQPPGDKLVSATPVAADWNAKRVLVPDPEVFPEVKRWLMPFLEVLRNFTGSGKEHDDDVDALGNAHAALQRDSDHSPVTAPSSRH